MAASSSSSQAAASVLRLARQHFGQLGLSTSLTSNAPLANAGQEGLAGLLKLSLRASSSHAASQSSAGGVMQRIRAYAAATVGARASATAVRERFHRKLALRGAALVGPS